MENLTPYEKTIVALYTDIRQKKAGKKWKIFAEHGERLIRTATHGNYRFVAIHSLPLGCNSGHLSFHSRRDLCKPFTTYGSKSPDRILAIVEIKEVEA